MEERIYLTLNQPDAKRAQIAFSAAFASLWLLAFYFVLILSSGPDLRAQVEASTNNPATAANATVRIRRNFAEAETTYKQQPASAEAAWRFARACYDLADIADSSSERAQIAEQGIASCRRIISLQQDSAAAHYYLGMNLAQLAQTRGLGALKLVKEMETEFEQARNLDENFDYAGPDRNLGLLYLEAPSLASIGSRSKARQHLQRAVKLAPEYPENRLNLIEAYLKWGDRHDATREFKALQESWDTARLQFAGQQWADTWADWQPRFNKTRKKIEEPPKALEAPHKQ